MATGNTLLLFLPQNNEPPASAFVTLDTRNGHAVLDFDGAANESAVFKGIMPRHYSGGGITVYIHYSMTSAVSGDIDWDVAFERVSDSQQDIDADGFATALSIDNTIVPSTSGFVDIVSVAFTNGAQIDSIVAGEGFRLKVTRDAVSDTATTDAELWAVELKET